MKTFSIRALLLVVLVAACVSFCFAPTNVTFEIVGQRNSFRGYAENYEIKANRAEEQYVVWQSSGWTFVECPSENEITVRMNLWQRLNLHKDSDYRFFNHPFGNTARVK